VVARDPFAFVIQENFKALSLGFADAQPQRNVRDVYKFSAWRWVLERHVNLVAPAVHVAPAVNNYVCMCMCVS